MIRHWAALALTLGFAGEARADMFQWRVQLVQRSKGQGAKKTNPVKVVKLDDSDTRKRTKLVWPRQGATRWRCLVWMLCCRLER